MRTIPYWLLITATFGLTACKGAPPPLDVGDLETETGEDEQEQDEVGDPPIADTGETGETGAPASFVPLDIEDGFGTCDPWGQDCPEGEKCVPYSKDGSIWNANRCVLINGDDQVGDTCTWDGITEGSDSCGAGSHCWDVMDVDGQLQGVCTTFCDGSPDDPVCEPGSSCLIANDSINLCVATCDPLSQDCGAGLGCFWANNDFQCIFTAGDILAGETCGFINDCAPGLLCSAAELVPGCNGSSCCTPYCDLSTPECGDAATECSAFFEEGTAPPNYEDVGVCIIPGA